MKQQQSNAATRHVDATQLLVLNAPMFSPSLYPDGQSKKISPISSPHHRFFATTLYGFFHITKIQVLFVQTRKALHTNNDK